MDSSGRAEVCYHTLWKRTQNINAKQETNASIKESILNAHAAQNPKQSRTSSHKPTANKPQS